MQWQAWLGGEGGYGTRNEKLPLLKGFQYCGKSREKVVAVFSLYSRMLSGRRFFVIFPCQAECIQKESENDTVVMQNLAGS